MFLDCGIEAGAAEIWDLVLVGEIRDVRVITRFVEPFVRWQGTDEKSRIQVGS